jgi:hypothetical protein
MHFPNLLFVFALDILTIPASAPPNQNYQLTPYATLTIHADTPYLDYLTSTQLIKEIAFVISTYPQRNSFPSTISEIREYDMIKRTSILLDADREKIAGRIWRIWEKEMEKVKMRERKKDNIGRFNDMEMRKGLGHGISFEKFLKHFSRRGEKKGGNGKEEKMEGKQNAWYVRIPRRGPWQVKDR